MQTREETREETLKLIFLIVYRLLKMVYNTKKLEMEIEYNG